MPDDTTKITQQLLAFVNTLRSLPPTQKEGIASSQYCEDANRLLELAREAIPEVNLRLWPAALRPNDLHGFRYVEIETFVLRILYLIQDITIEFHN